MANPTGTQYKMTFSEIMQLLMSRPNKALPGEANTLAAIAMAESGGNVFAHNPGTNQTPEDSWGLWQINLNAHPDITSTQASDPGYAADYAIKMLRDQGGKPWSVYNNQSYTKFLDPNQPASGNPYIDPLHPENQSGGQQMDPAAFDWNTPSLSLSGENGFFGDYGAWASVITGIAGTFADAGMALPPGAPDLATAAYQAALNNPANKSDPVTKATALATLQQMQQQLAQNEVLFPYDLQKIRDDIRASQDVHAREGLTLPLDIAEQEQRIRLGEPVGSESVLRTDAGNTGYRDYFASHTPNPDRSTDADYMAGFRIGQGSDQPRADAISSYLDRVVSEIGDQITQRGQNITAAVQEAQNKIEAYKSAGSQFTAALPFTIPKGAEWVPGFEEGGLATQIGLKPQKATTIPFNPFKMATDVVNSTQSPTGIPEVQMPGFSSDPSMFKDALSWYRSML